MQVGQKCLCLRYILKLKLIRLRTHLRVLITLLQVPPTQAVKSIFVKEIEERGLTPIIASHNLRELEDICEYVGLLHRGGILLAKDMEDMKINIHKIQIVIKDENTLPKIKEKFEVVKVENRGALYTITIRGKREDVDHFMLEIKPIFYELLPLSLEEIFISETEVKGYDIKSLIL